MAPSVTCTRTARRTASDDQLAGAVGVGDVAGADPHLADLPPLEVWVRTRASPTPTAAGAGSSDAVRRAVRAARPGRRHPRLPLLPAPEGRAARREIAARVSALLAGAP